VIHINPSDPRPLWSQVEEGMRALIAAGTLPAGDPVPSVRDLARELQINPATVSKAYQRLVAADLLVVRRGDGTYVAEATVAVAAQARARTLSEAALRYAHLAVAVGAARDEALAHVATAWRQVAVAEEGGRLADRSADAVPDPPADRPRSPLDQSTKAPPAEESGP
jgi:GntR family transcriptional regulator